MSTGDKIKTALNAGANVSKERLRKEIAMRMMVLTGACIAALALALSANAIPVIPTSANITLSGSPPFTSSTPVVANNTSPSDFGDGTVFDWLTADVTAWNSLESASLPAPVGQNNPANSPLVKVTTGSGPDTEDINVTGYSYVFLHWGGQGGGWAQAFYVGNLSGTYEFDAPPGGHPAVGGLSFYSLYGPTGSVPDGGTTLLLLGAALTGLGVIRSRLGK